MPDEAKTEEKSENVQLETSGYYYNDVWRPLSGVALQQFNDSTAVTQCLEDKVINMYGDSTARQWFEYLIAFVPGDVQLHLPFEPRGVAEIVTALQSLCDVSEQQ